MAKHVELRFSSHLHDTAPAFAVLKEHDCTGDLMSGATLWRGQEEMHISLHLYKITPEKIRAVWEGIRKVYPVQCAHIRDLDGARAGCIHDYLRASCCPHATISTTSDMNDTPCPALDRSQGAR